MTLSNFAIRPESPPEISAGNQAYASALYRTGTVLIFLFATLLWTYILSLPPPAKPATADPREFSTERARQHIKAIASTPHPMGSLANERVRTYLISRLEELGFQATVQETDVTHRFGQQVFFGHVHNVVARLRGAGDRAVLLMSHYDSIPTSPGANDNAAGVAAILEALRAVRETGYPAHDIIVLFTDGEEAGLLGAYAFVTSHPWVKDVSVAVNFEARGRYGPSLLFETGPGNRDIVNAIANAGGYTVGDSVMNAIYRLQPYQTDLTAFVGKNIPGLNFAYIGDASVYHRDADTPDSVSDSSLQHHGQHALDALRLLSPDQGETTANVVYFNALISTLWTFPIESVLPISLIALCLCALLLSIGTRRRLLRWRLVTKSAGLALLVPVLTGGVAFLTFSAAQSSIRAIEQLGWSPAVFAVTLAACIWMASAILALPGAASSLETSFGVASAMAVLAVLGALFEPETVHLCVFSALGGVVGWAIIGLVPTTSRFRWTAILAAFLVQIPAMAIAFRLAIVVFFLTGGTRPVAMAIAILFAMAATAVPLSFIQVGHLRLIRKLAMYAAIIIPGGLAAALNMPMIDQALPTQMVTYISDTSTRTAMLAGDSRWARRIATPLGLTPISSSSLEQWLPDADKFALQTFAAPYVAQGGSVLEVRARQPHGQETEINAMLTPARGVRRIIVYLPGIAIETIRVEGAIMGVSNFSEVGETMLYITAPNERPISLSFKRKTTDSTLLTIVDEFATIPNFPGNASHAVLPGINPYFLVPTVHSNSSVVLHRVRL